MKPSIAAPTQTATSITVSFIRLARRFGILCSSGAFQEQISWPLNLSLTTISSLSQVSCKPSLGRKKNRLEKPAVTEESCYFLSTVFSDGYPGKVIRSVLRGCHAVGLLEFTIEVVGVLIADAERYQFD